jgi:hypothetical protein
MKDGANQAAVGRSHGEVEGAENVLELPKVCGLESAIWTRERRLAMKEQ